ncbi:hypothetical protein [Mesorhizobium qingshengii]|uniref:Uncharacterized protein n=1 Tax=Mesorhizobium qingshengii TaxID=1165689 RepID=A0A1G5YZ36_9HYPH|nr:hypothetical protein [Mesorhizobium qingshengii]SDA87453.1 hypothetical protein SAMN02927914_03901 [Mesorhizobium qingshengii]
MAAAPVERTAVARPWQVIVLAELLHRVMAFPHTCCAIADSGAAYYTPVQRLSLPRHAEL